MENTCWCPLVFLCFSRSNSLGDPQENRAMNSKAQDHGGNSLPNRVLDISEYSRTIPEIYLAAVLDLVPRQIGDSLCVTMSPSDYIFFRHWATVPEWTRKQGYLCSEESPTRRGQEMEERNGGPCCTLLSEPRLSQEPHDRAVLRHSCVMSKAKSHPEDFKVCEEFTGAPQKRAFQNTHGSLD